MKKQKGFMGQMGLTLMELVIAIIVAIALGTGGLLVYKDLTGQAKAANKADLAAKVVGAIAVYVGRLNGTLPTGTDLASVSNMQNVQCSSGLMQLKSDTSVSVSLTNVAGTALSDCATSVYGVSA
jgi:type II secretory pathway pseudopilin PulG